MMKNTSKLVAIALTERCALEVVNDKYRVLKSKPNGKAFKVHWKKGKYCVDEIKSKKEFESLKELLKK
jgi:hypothetical protein